MFRFGKTSVSDIDAFVQLADGKVLSGSEWGNMLVWDGGLIKVDLNSKFMKLVLNLKGSYKSGLRLKFAVKEESLAMKDPSNK